MWLPRSSSTFDGRTNPRCRLRPAGGAAAASDDLPVGSRESAGAARVAILDAAGAERGHRHGHGRHAGHPPRRPHGAAPRSAGRADPLGRTVPYNSAARPTTPDGRYFVVHGRLWRKANPQLSADVRNALVKQLMDARRALRGTSSDAERRAAREQVDNAKRALGERGPVWWTDGSPDCNRKMANDTPYGDWFARLSR